MGKEIERIGGPEDVSRLREVLLSRPPRFIRGVLLLSMLLLGVGLVWASSATIDVVVRGEGIVRPIAEPVSVQTKAGGKIAEVFASPGKEVKEGDLLLRFETKELATRLNSLKSRLQSQRSRLSELKDIRKHYLREKTLYEEQGRIQKKLLELQIASAKRELRRERRLYEQDAVSKAEYQKSETRYKTRQNELRKARKAIQIRETELARQVRQTDLQIEDLESEIRRLQSQLRQLELKSAETEIRAPVSGIIVTGEPQSGEVVPAGEQLFSIASIDELRFDVLVPESERANVYEGQPAQIRITAFPHYEHGLLKGEVFYISPDRISSSELSENFQAGNLTSKRALSGYHVKIQITKGAFIDRLTPGMKGEVELQAEEKSLIELLSERVEAAIDFW